MELSAISIWLSKEAVDLGVMPEITHPLSKSRQTRERPSRLFPIACREGQEVCIIWCHCGTAAMRC